MSPAAQALYDQYSADMVQASAGMDAHRTSYVAYRNCQAAYCEARDTRYEIAKAADPEGIAHAEAVADYQATQALSNSL
jgi:hypothetical protein